MQNGKEEIEEIKERIKKIQWLKISDNWSIKYRRYKNAPYRKILLDPYSDCSKINPLFKHKIWLERIYNDYELKLGEYKLSEICGVSHGTIFYWRKKHNIPARESTERIVQKHRVSIRPPEGYGNPILKTQKGYMLEHRYVMEIYLADHPELEWSKKYLFDGRNLKSSCHVHHINFDPLDNRFENFWLCKSGREHQLIEASLFALVDELLKFGLIVFENGKYYLNKS